ncbi:MAG: winged helix-turn-helix domain-containing protein [Candidatus Omnitrophica bacterium]|nr:winged helix-turn-helix domain-containing protein [Candidatus Omnitrophota bacterium]
MKEQIMDTAGKIWQFLAQNGEAEITALAKRLKEHNDVVLQSLGWLAREDKICYTQRKNKTCVALVQAELEAFNRVAHSIPAAPPVKKKTRKTTKKS